MIDLIWAFRFALKQGYDTRLLVLKFPN